MAAGKEITLMDGGAGIFSGQDWAFARSPLYRLRPVMVFPVSSGKVFCTV